MNSQHDFFGADGIAVNGGGLDNVVGKKRAGQGELMALGCAVK